MGVQVVPYSIEKVSILLITADEAKWLHFGWIGKWVSGGDIRRWFQSPGIQGLTEGPARTFTTHFKRNVFFQTKKSSKEMRSLLLGLGIGHRQCWWLEIGRWQIFKLACAHSYFDSGQQHLCRQSPFHRLILFMRWSRVEWSGHLLCIQSQMKFLWAKISDQNIFIKCWTNLAPVKRNW